MSIGGPSNTSLSHCAWRAGSFQTCRDQHPSVMERPSRRQAFRRLKWIGSCRIRPIGRILRSRQEAGISEDASSSPLTGMATLGGLGPLALDAAVKDGRIKRGDWFLMEAWAGDLLGAPFAPLLGAIPNPLSSAFSIDEGDAAGIGSGKKKIKWGENAWLARRLTRADLSEAVHKQIGLSRTNPPTWQIGLDLMSDSLVEGKSVKLHLRHIHGSLQMVGWAQPQNRRGSADTARRVWFPPQPVDEEFINGWHPDRRD